MASLVTQLVREQAEGYHDAIIRAGSLLEIDCSEILICGIGNSGGASMITTGDDPSVMAVITMMPFFFAAFDAKNFPAGMTERIAAACDERTQTPVAEPVYVTVWDELAEVALRERGQTLQHGPATHVFINKARERFHAAIGP